MIHDHAKFVIAGRAIVVELILPIPVSRLLTGRKLPPIPEHLHEAALAIEHAGAGRARLGQFEIEIRGKWLRAFRGHVRCDIQAECQEPRPGGSARQRGRIDRSKNYAFNDSFSFCAPRNRTENSRRLGTAHRSAVATLEAASVGNAHPTTALLHLHYWLLLSAFSIHSSTLLDGNGLTPTWRSMFRHCARWCIPCVVTWVITPPRVKV